MSISIRLSYYQSAEPNTLPRFRSSPVFIPLLTLRVFLSLPPLTYRFIQPQAAPLLSSVTSFSLYIAASLIKMLLLMQKPPVAGYMSLATPTDTMPSTTRSTHTPFPSLAPDVCRSPHDPSGSFAGTTTSTPEEPNRLQELQSSKSQGQSSNSKSGDVYSPDQQCDEKRPVCDKCRMHYTNIQTCDYGDESPSGSESMTKKPAPDKSRRAQKAVPILPKSRHQQQSLRPSSSAESNWDPFSQHPPSVEPDISLLMGTCQSTPVMHELERTPTDHGTDFSSHIFNVFPYVSSLVSLGPPWRAPITWWRRLSLWGKC